MAKSSAVQPKKKEVKNSRGRVFEYWACFWMEGRKRRSKTLGLASELSKRQANVLRDRLVVDLGRVPDRLEAAPNLGEHIQRYLANRTEIKENTRREHETTGRYLKACLGEDIRIDKITRTMAADWRASLARGELAHVQQGKCRELKSEDTVCKHTRNAKTIFQLAVDEDLILFNPFDRLKGRADDPDKSWHYLEMKTFAMLLSQCPDLGWRVLLALCRLAALRRGEALRLQWQDVDWESRRLTVRNSDRRRTTKKRTRLVPIVPELYRLLMEAYEEAEDGAEIVVSPQMVSRSSCHKRFKSIVRACKLEPWSDLFHTMRKNCETDWAMKYPQHVVAEWAGHDKEIAEKHYLNVPKELFDKAASQPMMPQPEGEVRNNCETKTGPEEPVAVSAYTNKYPRQGSNLQPSASEADALSN